MGERTELSIYFLCNLFSPPDTCRSLFCVCARAGFWRVRFRASRVSCYFQNVTLRRNGSGVACACSRPHRHACHLQTVSGEKAVG